MAEDIAQWLNRLGLDQYAQAFAENGIDFDILPRISDDNLKDLGLNLGDRVRFQAGVEALITGQPLTASATPLVQDIAPQSNEADRRQLTVLFCDLVGSTELSAKLDPEDMREVLHAYQDACSKVISLYDGYVAKFMGDGVYAYFGYPTAHEDDAERAINAGLGIVKSIEKMQAKRGALAVRIGIATGNVAVGDLIGEGASEEANVVGDAPNLAARLQGIAEPNTIVIGEATHMLASGMFETEDLGSQDLKGFAHPVGAWSILGPSASESRFEATRGKNLTELVGRDEEMEILVRRWQRAVSGEGQTALISGEPGIGKSRLVSALRESIGDTPHLRLSYQCSPYHTHSAFYPVIQHLERAARFESEDDAEARLDKLEAMLRPSGANLAAIAPLIASLLSIPSEGRYDAPRVTSQERKILTLTALVDQVAGLAACEPVLFVMEDAHWIDPTTLELLMLTVERVPQLAVLMVITHRPEFAAPWIGQPRVTPIILNRLESRDCERLIENIVRSVPLPPDLRTQIAERSDGIPLFAEELTKSVLESSGTLDPAGVPTTIQDSLEARLDRLGSAKELAQVASVLGRSFNYRLLARASGVDEARLHQDLGALTESELVSSRGEPPDASYMFRHALIQDTAYQSMLRGRRRELHGDVARVLEEVAGEGVPTEPEVIGFHHAEAGNHLQAADYYAKAGEEGYASWAVEEGLSHLNRALELIENVPKDRARLVV